MANPEKYANPYTTDDDETLFIQGAVRSNHTGDIHFGPDPRFISTMDQTRWCFTLFNNWARCVEKLGEDAERCKYLHHKFRVITPVGTQELWEEQLADGKWAGYDPNYNPPPLVIDRSIKPSRTRHLEKKHHDEDHH